MHLILYWNETRRVSDVSMFVCILSSNQSYKSQCGLSFAGLILRIL